MEELTNEMNKTTAQLQLDLQLLRERFYFVVNLINRIEPTAFDYGKGKK